VGDGARVGLGKILMWPTWERRVRIVATPRRVSPSCRFLGLWKRMPKARMPTPTRPRIKTSLVIGKLRGLMIIQVF